jgi:hypothetical protein
VEGEREREREGSISRCGDEKGKAEEEVENKESACNAGNTVDLCKVENCNIERNLHLFQPPRAM